MKLNFKDVESKTGLLPDGTFLGVVEAIEEKQDSKGHPMYNWTFAITSKEEEDGSLNEAFKGRKTWANTSCKQDGLWKLLEFLLALGIDEDEVKADDGYEFVPEEWIGADIRLAVKFKKGTNGYKDSNEVSLLPTTGDVAAMDDFK